MFPHKASDGYSGRKAAVSSSKLYSIFSSQKWVQQRYLPMYQNRRHLSSDFSISANKFKVKGTNLYINFTWKQVK